LKVFTAVVVEVVAVVGGVFAPHLMSLCGTIRRRRHFGLFTDLYNGSLLSFAAHYAIDKYVQI